jgi:hypothetical protein
VTHVTIWQQVAQQHRAEHIDPHPAQIHVVATLLCMIACVHNIFNHDMTPYLTVYALLKLPPLPNTPQPNSSQHSYCWPPAVLQLLHLLLPHPPAAAAAAAESSAAAVTAQVPQPAAAELLSCRGQPALTSLVDAPAALQTAPAATAAAAAELGCTLER